MLYGLAGLPFVLVLVLSLLIFLPLRTGLDYLRFDKYVWHRPLADACLFIITEMDTPFDGLIVISSHAMRDALAHMSQ